MISVIIPTVRGREASLGRCVRAYMERFTFEPPEILIETGHACCGDAWNAGAAKASGEFLHWTADDLEPGFGWDRAALQAVGAHAIPAPIIYKPDGGIESVGGHWGQVPPLDWQETLNTCVVPFCSRKQWEQIGPHLPGVQYFGDNYFTDRAKAAGYRVAIRVEYGFVHHWEQPGRGAGMSEPDRMAHDKAIYEKATGA